MNFSLKGKTALVTGGGSGIGFAISKAFVEQGAKVIITGRNEQKLIDAKKEIGGDIQSFAFDVTSMDEITTVKSQLQKDGIDVDILINNAGNHVKKPAVDVTQEDFQRILDVHVLAAHNMIRVFAPDMMQRGSGSILFIASMASLFGIPYVIAYAAAKSAMLGMVRTYATELSPEGVRVNAVAPGWIDTAMSRGALDSDPERKNKILSRTPMHKLGQIEDIAHAAVFLSSEEANFITGTCLPVDGGISIGF